MSKLQVETISHTNNTTAQTIDSSGNVTLAGTLGSGAITSTGAVQGTQFNVDGFKVLETVNWNFGSSANKTVDTAYQYTTDLASGTWLPIYRGYLWIFENHGNSNSTGIYMEVIYLGTSAGGEQYGNGYLIQPKWGNSANSYGDTSSIIFPAFTISSTTTVHAQWQANEYGGSSNYWVRNSSTKGFTFMRIG